MEQSSQEQKIPLGFVFKPNEEIKFTAEQFSHLLQITEALSNLILTIKQKHFEIDVFRWYYKEDLVELKDESGNLILQQDGKTPKYDLRSDFWS